jgi:hypothetical protein
LFGTEDGPQSSKVRENPSRTVTDTKVREGVKIIAPEVFKIHPDDLEA